MKQKKRYSLTLLVIVVEAKLIDVKGTAISSLNCIAVFSLVPVGDVFLMENLQGIFFHLFLLVFLHFSFLFSYLVIYFIICTWIRYNQNEGKWFAFLSCIWKKTQNKTNGLL